MDEKKVADLFYRHAIGSEKYGAGLADRIVRLLNASDEDLMLQIAGRYALIEKKGFDRGPATTKRLEDLLQAIRAINGPLYAKIAKALSIDLQAVAQHEMDFTTSAVRTAGGVVDLGTTLPSAAFLKTLVENTPIDGRLLGSWTKGLEDARVDRLEQAIRIGLLQGETPDSLVKRIRGTKENGYRDGILQISRQSAQTLALTANATIQNAASLETFRKMPRIKYVEWSSVLDSRTSPICQSRSGTVYPIDKPHPTPPAHPRCRSRLLPRKDNTSPPLHRPYPDWLKDQPAHVQDEALNGKTRGNLYRAGKLDTKDIYRQDGKFKSLAELKVADAKIFED